MSNPVISAVKACFATVVLLTNIVIAFSMVMPLALIKLVLPFKPVRVVVDYVLSKIAEGWIGVNNFWIRTVNRGPWHVTGADSFRYKGWYLVSSNHQSWVDILVLQRVLHGHVPMLKFFLKAELIWVPVIGLAWWALDFPFMKRGRGHGARASDLKTTRQACEKFKRIPTAVMNFVEGTRFTKAKHHAQHSPYRHLLKPKIGGLGIALATMGEQFEAMLDITIVYPHGAPTFWDLLTGRVDAVIVRVQHRDIPPDVLGGDPVGDKAYRQRLSAWIEGQWAEKDALIAQLLGSR
ncbi:MAG TPA: acyltransferase [Aquabacterium sp.]|nr:acyltransferase [Aquabacterium sp.]